MARRTARKRKGARGSGGSGRGFVAVVLLVLFGVLAWWAWRHSRFAPPGSALRQGGAPVVNRPAATNTRPAATVPPPTPEDTVPSPAPPPVVLSTNRFRHAAEETPPAVFTPRTVTNLLEAQIALAAHGISAGSIDGSGGAQTAAALRAFQMSQALEQTGWLDKPTRDVLRLNRAPLGWFTVTAEDLARLAPVPSTWLGKSQAASLDHETLLELVAESSQAHPAFIRKLNPSMDWDHPAAGVRLLVPVPPPATPRRAELIRISLAGRYLRGFDGRGELLAHFPCSIASRVEKRPVGELHVAVAVENPDYTFDPEVFPESPEARTMDRKLRLPPGPNNPVGIAWIGLDRPGYGIHGTPRPEDVGRTESHGCFRLANWNADLLRRMVWVGLPVRVEP